MAFRGTFDYSLDAKHRLTVPAKFRATLSDGLVLAKGTAPCIAIWTPDQFDAYVSAALAELHPMSPQADKIDRFFQANSVDSELDSAGRVGIPEFLRQYAGLTKEVVVTGVRNRLEVWDRERWHEYNGALDITELTQAFGGASAS